MGKIIISNNKILVGGLEHEFYNFPFSWEFHHPNWRTHVFQRGSYTTNQIIMMMIIIILINIIKIIMIMMNSKIMMMINYRITLFIKIICWWCTFFLVHKQGASRERHRRWWDPQLSVLSATVKHWLIIHWANWSGWWFGFFFLILPNSWDDDPIWLIFFRWVETTNQWLIGGIIIVFTQWLILSQWIFIMIS